MTRARSLAASWRRLAEERASTAVEFAMILPIILLMTLGTIETATVLFEIHKLNDAARRIARAAIIQPAIPKISDLQAGAVVCIGQGASVSCGGASIAHPASFASLLAEGRVLVPNLKAENVRLIYEDSGTVQMVSGEIVTPSVTVELMGVTFESFILSHLLDNIEEIWTLPIPISARVGASEVL